jgi:hypothetical protein
MGFLKQLFEKKLQDAASMEAMEVGQRVRSEYTLPHLRGQGPGQGELTLGT